MENKESKGSNGSKENMLECGKILNTHGIHGELKIEPWCDDALNFFGQIKTIYIDGAPRTLLSARAHKTFILACIEGVDCPEDAMVLKNKIISISRDEVSLPDDYYFVADILGFDVFDLRTNAIIGKLDYVQDMPAHDMYVIKSEGGEILVPAVPEFVEKVDFENKQLVLKTIKGMLPNED